MSDPWTPGPWECVPGNEHHGPYVAGAWGGDVCDCYTMSDPTSPSVRNGGTSKPIWFQPAFAQANARLISAAPELAEAALEVDVFCTPLNDDRHDDEVVPVLMSLGTIRKFVAALAKARGENV